MTLGWELRVDNPAFQATNIMIDLSPQDAWALLQANPDAKLVDIRMEVEFLYVGSPPGAINIPWYEYPNLEPDVQKFTEAVRRELPDLSKPIVLLCRSAKRTVPAGAALEAAGYQRVYQVAHGFEGDLDEHGHRSTVNGWRFEGLPWAQT